MMAKMLHPSRIRFIPQSTLTFKFKYSCKVKEFIQLHFNPGLNLLKKIVEFSLKIVILKKNIINLQMCSRYSPHGIFGVYIIWLSEFSEKK